MLKLRVPIAASVIHVAAMMIADTDQSCFEAFWVVPTIENLTIDTNVTGFDVVGKTDACLPLIQS